MGLREWGLALILALSSCNTVREAPPEKPGLEYKLGVEFTDKADKEGQKELYEKAIEYFKKSEQQGNKTIESILKQAYCHAQLENKEKAFELINSVLKKEHSPLVFYAKGLAEQRFGMHDEAIESYTKSIEMGDSAGARWQRFNCYMHAKEEKPPQLDKALEDINRYIELMPDEPDGYISKSLTCIFIYNKNGKKEEDSKQAYQALKAAFKLRDEGKEFKRQLFNLAEPGLRQEYEDLKTLPENQEKPKEPEKPKKKLY